VKKRRATAPLKELYRCFVDKSPVIAERIFSSVKTPCGENLLSALQHSKFSEIVSATIAPKDYSNADTFGRDYLCVELMSKYPNWELGISRSDVALQKFHEAEAICSDTNRRMRTSLGRPLVGMPAHPVLLLASRKIEKLLGPFSWPEIFRSCQWGPGATTRLKRRNRDVYYKFKGLPHATPDAYDLARKMIATIPGWDPGFIEIVPGNRVTTVPKNAKTDRVIAIEPDLNMVIQKGIGNVIRQRLQRVGLLDTRQGRNPQILNNCLAQEGSAYGRFSTIDLSMASDTVSLELVRTLIPPRWLDALEQSRSDRGILPCGSLVEYHKFSSMGNGYTFELETLIFWAICSAVQQYHQLEVNRLLVFGDDIIIPSDWTQPVIEALQQFGFIPNLKKSWIDGPFRESCGKHYFRGADVTPFYIRGPVDDIERLYWVANSIRRWSRCEWGLDPLLRSCYEEVVSSIPRALRFRIPDGYGDGGLISDWDEATPSKAPKGQEGWKYRFVAADFNSNEYTDRPYLLKALYGLEQGGVGGGLGNPWFAPPSWEHLRSDRVSNKIPGREKKRIMDNLVPRWPNHGPWLEG
jgi:hypothetical protein